MSTDGPIDTSGIEHVVQQGNQALDARLQSIDERIGVLVATVGALANRIASLEARE